jgi:hypothetical protein
MIPGTSEQCSHLSASQDGLYFVEFIFGNSIVNICIAVIETSSCVTSQPLSQPINKLISTEDSCFRISILSYTYTVDKDPIPVYL